MSYVEARLPVQGTYPFATVPFRCCTGCGALVHPSMMDRHDRWHATTPAARVVGALKRAAAAVPIRVYRKGDVRG